MTGCICGRVGYSRSDTGWCDAPLDPLKYRTEQTFYELVIFRVFSLHWSSLDPVSEAKTSQSRLHAQDYFFCSCKLSMEAISSAR